MAERNVSIRLSVEDAETVRRTLDQVGASGQQLAQKLGEASKAARAADIAAYGAELDRLRAKYNPLFAAQQQYRATLAEINQAQRVGAISTAEHAAAIQRTKDAFAAQVVALNSGPGGGAIGGMRQYRNVVQAAGFQIGDFATQIASGQNALVAFTQQGSQMLQFFGPMGAAAGAVLAIVGALAIALRASASGTESVADAAKKAEEAQKAYNEVMLTANEQAKESARLAAENAINLAHQRVETLALAKAQADANLKRKQDFLDTLEESARGGTRRQLGPQIDTAIIARDRAAGEVAILQRDLDEANAKLAALQDPTQRGAAREEAAKAVDDTRKALAQLRAELDPNVAATQKYDEAVATLGKALADGLISYKEWLELTGRARAALEGADKSLKDKLKSDAQFWAQNDAAAERGAQQYDELIKKQNQRQQSLEKYIRGLETSAEAEKLNSTEKQVQLALQEAQNKLIDEQGHKLRDLTEREKERIATAVRSREQEKQATQELERFSERAFDRIGAAITEAFVQGKAAAIDFRGVMMGILSEIAQEFIKLSILNPLKNILFGQDNKTLGDIFGPKKAPQIPDIPYPSGFAGFFASGTDFAPRGLAVVGESGPELINFRGGEQVISANRTRTILSRGQGGNQYFIDARGADAGAVQRLERALIQLAGPGVVERRAITAVTSARQRGMVPA